MLSNDSRNIRRIIAEDPEWNLFIVPPLSEICLKCLTNCFATYPVFSEVLRIDVLYAEKLLQRLPSTLPLAISVPLIDNSLYWKKLYLSRWNFCENSLNLDLWKRMYLERYLGELIESHSSTTLPERHSSSDYSEQIDEVLSVSSEVIKSLIINHLQPALPLHVSFGELGTEFNEANPSSNATLEFFNPKVLLSKLENLESFIISYTVKDVGMNFDLRHYNFSKIDANNIAAGVGLCASLSHLGVTKSLLDCYHVKIFSNVLIQHPSLKSIDFSHNKISDHGFRYFGKILSSPNCHLTHIDLSNNCIGTDGTILFSLGLERNSSLQSLDLRLNVLGDEGSEHILRALMRNSTLVVLNLSCNGMTESSCRNIADTLVVNKGLKIFDLSCNQFLESGGKHLQDRIEENTTLLDFKLSLTHISQETETFIFQILERNKRQAEGASI